MASNKDLRAIYDSLIRANLSAQQQWKDELKFREEDAKKTNPRLTVETTQGKFVIELFEDDAPNTTASMVALANAKFFDGLTFHRFVNHFVIQGGCPKGDGTGDPGYRLRSEVNKRNHFRGMVGMACTGPKTNTEGSQFYVCLSDNESVKSLSGKYVIVGRVIEGLEAVEKLRAGDKMTSVKASNLRDHEYVPKKLTD
ncbi:MAG: peptidylprolyl isomerase [Planctomycetes bacterium]|nr:peptidylprolyl isomerase [Planctomycetota bacterium]